MNIALPEDFAMTSLRAGDSERAVAKMVDGDVGEDGGMERRWDVMARPRPREQPVMR